MLKVNSAEINNGINKNDIEFYFEEVGQDNTTGSIIKMELYKKGNNTCFDYNDDYYENPLFNSYLNETNDDITERFNRYK